MTALERAKAFIKSRATRTALTIMPLALATVVTVSTKAHANTQPTFNGVNAQWVTANCTSGGIAACLSPYNNSANGPVAFMTNGSEADGTATGTYVVKGAPGGPVDLLFFMSGGGTGTLLNPIAIQYSFNVTCPGCSASDTFSYDVTGSVLNSIPQQFDVDSGLQSIANSATNTTGTIYINPVTGDLGEWEAGIDFHWNGVAGESATFDVNQLAIYPTSGTSTVPEPASLLLALSGLPLIGTLLRKKK